MNAEPAAAPGNAGYYGSYTPARGRVQVTGLGDIPASVVSAVILNATVTHPRGPGY